MVLGWLSVLVTTGQPAKYAYQLAVHIRNAASTKTPVSFAHVTNLQDGKHYLADENGHLMIRSTRPITRLEVTADLYLTKRVSVDDKSQLDIDLVKLFPWPDGEPSDPQALALIDKTIDAANLNDADELGNYQCQIYHKLSVRTDSLEAVKQLINAGFRIFSQAPLPPGKEHHYLFLAETSSRKFYKSAQRQKELIDGIRLSGIQQFSGSLPLAQLQGFGIYQDYITIRGQDYIGPFAGAYSSRYNFQIIDTVPADNDTLVVVRFSPAPGKQVKTLRGYLYISAKDYGIAHAVCMPGILNGTEMLLAQTYRRVTNGFHKWAPYKYLARLNKPNAIGNIPVDLVQEGYVTAFGQIRPEAGKKSWRYDGVIIESEQGASTKDSTYWTSHRPQKLTAAEGLTYDYYNKVGNLKSVDRLLSLTEQLYEGQIGYGTWALDLNKVVAANPYEALRLGLGISRYWYDNRLTTSGYLGYGFQDRAYKYGISTDYVLDTIANLRISYKFSDDLSEPGQPQFLQDKPTSSAERLRKYLIPRFDRELRHQAGLTINSRPNLVFGLSSQWRYIRPLYSYFYAPEQDLSQQTREFTTSEVSLAMRWGIGERFMRFKKSLVDLDIAGPVIQGTVTVGQASLAHGLEGYRRYDLKVSQAFKAPDWGETSVQLLAGRIDGKVPYSLLWTGRASYQDASAVTTNSFETMRFNEFMADRYMAIFMVHQFDPIELKGFPYFPYLSLVHNMGIGWLDGADRHQEVGKLDLSNGYFESGVFINDVFVFNLGGLRTGLGLGAFGRYGASARPAFWDNAVFKLALEFGV